MNSPARAGIVREGNPTDAYADRTRNLEAHQKLVEAAAPGGSVSTTDNQIDIASIVQELQSAQNEIRRKLQAIHADLLAAGKVKKSRRRL
jgi:hypothetical protein